MSPQQVIVIIALLANFYGVDSGQATCMIYHESSFRVGAVNGIHVGLAQWNPETFEWLALRAVQDKGFYHREYVFTNLTEHDPLTNVLVFIWAVDHGYEEHWSTLEECSGPQLAEQGDYGP